MAHTSLASLFTDIADAIRGKTGGSAALVADNFPTAIASIPGCMVASVTATPSSDSGSLSFTVSSSMSGLPKMFSCAPGLYGTTHDLSTGSRYIMSLQYDGSVLYGESVYRGSSTGNIYGYNDRYTVSRSGNTLTISEDRTGMSSSLYTYFKSGLVYRLVYAY